MATAKKEKAVKKEVLTKLSFQDTGENDFTAYLGPCRFGDEYPTTVDADTFAVVAPCGEVHHFGIDTIKEIAKAIG